MRRAGGTVVAAVTLAGLAAMPAALLGSTGAAAAATHDTAKPTAAAQGAKTPAAVAITGMNPPWAGPRSAITISGLLSNTSKAPVSGLVVQLYTSPTPVSSIAEITPGTVPFYDRAGIQKLPGAWWRSGRLQPGQSVPWRIPFRARRIGMTLFGVYPVAAVAQDRAGAVLGTSTSYLPYVPGKNSPYLRPKRERISWLWPLIDKPMLGAPWQKVCRAPQAKSLARSMSAGGRLANLVAVGQRSTAARGEPPPSLAGRDGITWAVDPALLANAKALTTCRSTAPGLAHAAAIWLASVGKATAGQPLFALPYGDPNVVALIRQNHQDDVKDTYRLGRDVTKRILGRDVSPSASQQVGASAQTAAIAWPAGGTAGFATVENLAGYQIRVRTVVLNSSALPQAPGTVVRTLNGGGSFSTLLLANDSLDALLGSAASAGSAGSAGAAPGSAFATSQQFLAETALLAVQQPGQPIVIAPPARWDPPAGLATSVLADTASAPWLSPVSLTALVNRKSAPDVVLPEGSPGEPSYPKKELSGLKLIGQQIYQMESLQAIPQTDLYLAIGAVESSAWDGKSRATAQAMLHAMAAQVATEQAEVYIVAGKAGIRITLGGLKGSVPVSIVNKLNFAVKVRVRLYYNQATGIKIVADPAVVTIQANRPLIIKLHVQATQVGTTTLTMRLENSRGQLLPSSRAARMTLQATQVGVLGMIIFACALGVVLIASAARAVRNGRPVPGGASTPRDGANPDGMGSDQVGNPATVEPERSELAAPGPTGP